MIDRASHVPGHYSIKGGWGGVGALTSVLLLQALARDESKLGQQRNTQTPSPQTPPEAS